MAKVIIDADPGVDDSLAIILACKSKFIELLGITVVAGNCGIENGVRNSFKVLDMCNKNHIPVYKGAEVSLENRKVEADYVHGKNGFGDLKYEPIIKSTSGDAVDYLIHAVNENPGQVDIVAVGPLTNIALAIMRNNDFAKNVKSILIMGSAKVKGNVTKFAEFNFYQDPHAAKIVLDSDIKDILIFGLNVTEELSLTQELENELKNSKSEIAQIIYKITRLGAEFDRSCGHEGLIVNDPLTIAYLIDSNVAKLTLADVDIATEGEQIGKSYISLKENGKCKVAYQVNPELFYNILFEDIL